MPPAADRKPDADALLANIRNARVASTLEAALVAARAAGSGKGALDEVIPAAEPLVDRLERESGMPGPRPNLELARAVGAVLGASRGPGALVADALVAHGSAFTRFVAAFGFAELWLAKFDRKRSFAALHDLAGLEQREARSAAVLALRVMLGKAPEETLEALRDLTDGYLHATTALEALADRDVLANISSGAGVLARLDEAFEIADASPRAAERLQGVRNLREEVPARVVKFAERFPETLDWIEKQAARKRPETRDVVAAIFKALRKAGVKTAEVDRLQAALTASAPIPRYVARIVQGTRKRSRGR